MIGCDNEQKNDTLFYGFEPNNFAETFQELPSLGIIATAINKNQEDYKFEIVTGLKNVYTISYDPAS